MFVYIYVCIYVCTYVCMYVCMFVWIAMRCIYMFMGVSQCKGFRVQRLRCYNIKQMRNENTAKRKQTGFIGNLYNFYRSRRHSRNMSFKDYMADNLSKN